MHQFDETGENEASTTDGSAESEGLPIRTAVNVSVSRFV